MPFKLGQSGNPSGRPKVVAEVRDLARQHTTMAIQTLVEIAADKKQNAQARVAASNSLLDRGYGRPFQSVSVASEVPQYRRVIVIERGKEDRQQKSEHALAQPPSLSTAPTLEHH